VSRRVAALALAALAAVLVILALVPEVWAPSAAGAQGLGPILWGATGGGQPGQLYRIDPTTGAATLVGPLRIGGAPIAVTGLAVDPTTNRLYGTT
jgi:DNA-binding beta-propeller fold protein YncE